MSTASILDPRHRAARSERKFARRQLAAIERWGVDGLSQKLAPNGSTPNKYVPHQSTRECERRRRKHANHG